MEYKEIIEIANLNENARCMALSQSEDVSVLVNFATVDINETVARTAITRLFEIDGDTHFNEILNKTKHETVHIFIARNSTDNETLSLCTSFSSFSVHFWALKNPHLTDQNILNDRMLNGEYPQLRQNAVININSKDVGTLKRAAKDKDSDVRKAAKARLVELGASQQALIVLPNAQEENVSVSFFRHPIRWLKTAFFGDETYRRMKEIRDRREVPPALLAKLDDSLLGWKDAVKEAEEIEEKRNAWERQLKTITSDIAEAEKSRDEALTVTADENDDVISTSYDSVIAVLYERKKETEEHLKDAEALLDTATTHKNKKLAVFEQAEKVAKMYSKLGGQMNAILQHESEVRALLTHDTRTAE